MSKTKVKTVVQQPTPPAQEEEDDSDVEFVLDREPEKDAVELELERLVFGDSAGFRAGLGELAVQDGNVEEEEDEEGQEETGYEGVEDADLFFTDTGDAPLPNTAAEDSSDDDTTKGRLPAAWQDSDDERTLVSLASAPRLRKLRRTEAEDVVNGKDYTRRLRQQFELLHPRPQWATHALQGGEPARKKRRLSGDEDESSADEMEMDDDDIPSTAPLSRLLRDASTLTRSTTLTTGKKRKILRPEVINIQRLPDLPPGPGSSAITSLNFHPSLPLILSSGPSSTLYLHHLAPSPPAAVANPLLTSLHVKGSELTTTAFHPKDSRIFLSARRRYFHVWDLKSGKVEKITRVYGQQHEQRSMERFKLSPCGSYLALLGSSRKGGGVVNILSASSLQWIAQVRVESRGGIADFCWWGDGKGLAIVGKGGEVTEWNVERREVVARWQDEGAVGTTVLALGGKHDLGGKGCGTDRWVAVGSSSGIVNIYDRRVWLAGVGGTGGEGDLFPRTPKPTKTLGHLTTPTSSLTFSPDGQLLVMASKWKRDAVKLVHLPSCTVFQNWPTSQTPLGRVTGVAVAEGGIVGGKGDGDEVFAVLAVANEKGAVRVWECGKCRDAFRKKCHLSKTLIKMLDRQDDLALLAYLALKHKDSMFMDERKVYDAVVAIAEGPWYGEPGEFAVAEAEVKKACQEARGEAKA
ncbi:U3 snoRNP protein [Elasticomyces elasticus]|nr:U3 snoRNP protein [Elasticomyces elasticus]